MKETVQKNDQKAFSSSNELAASTSSDGFAITPPTYGVSFVDQGNAAIIQAKLENEQVQEDGKLEREAEHMSKLVTQASNIDNTKQKSQNFSYVNSNSGIPVSPEILSQLKRSNGFALPTQPRAEMEATFGADFTNVKIHTDGTAIGINKTLGARAIAYGSNIYFNQGQFNPLSQKGKGLLAHELTHTIQQRSISTVQRAADGSTESSFLDDIIGFFTEYADDIPGYALFSTIIEYDIIRDKNKKRTPENFLQGIMGLVPIGNKLFLALKDSDALQQSFDWLVKEVQSLNITYERIKGILLKIKEKAGISDLLTGDIVDILEKAFTPLYNRVVEFGEEVIQTIFTFFKETLLKPLLSLAKETKGYELLTKVLGKDPISGEVIEATTEEILEDFLILLGKEQELEEMKKRGSLKRTAAWLEEQVETFFSLLDEMKGAFLQIWNNFSLEDWIADPLGKLNEVVQIFKVPVAKFVAFGITVAQKVLKFIKDKLLSLLGNYLKKNLRGFKLLTVILGEDPITHETVERTGENLILGFLSLILPDDRIQEIQSTSAIAQTIDWILAKVDELGMTMKSVVQLFLDLWHSFKIEDIMEPVKAFTRIMAQFGKPILKIFDFIKEVVLKVVEVILQIMQFPIDVVKSIMENATKAFEDIKRDPVQFFINLLNAIKLGFTQFFDNILTHLWNGVKAWLFRQLEKANITPPEDLSLESVLSLVMEILGISTENIFEKIEKKIGKEKADRLRALGDKAIGIWNFVQDILTGGPAALWEKVQEQLSNLWETALGFIQDWLMEKVIDKVVKKLLSMLDPSGIMAVVNSVIALYDTIRSAIEYFTEMLEIVNNFVVGIAEIARGTLNKAANFLENALSEGMPLAVGFLANFLGLDDLANQLREILAKVRIKVDDAIDWLVDQAIKLGGNLLEAGKNVVKKIENWWKAKKVFTASDGEKHTLFFKGNEEDAVLMIASTPTNFSSFINDLSSTDSNRKKIAKDIAQEIDSIKNSFVPKRKWDAMSREERKEFLRKKREKIENRLDLLSAELYHLLSNEDIHEGTKRDPIEIIWYKPQSAYPRSITLDDRLKGQVTINFGQQKKINLDQEKLTKYIPGLHTNLVRRYLEGEATITIGVEGKFLPDRLKNQPLKKVKSYRRILKSEPQKVFRTVLIISGRNMRDLKEDADHVQDLQFQGIDDLNNLWSLNEKVNRSSLKFGKQIVKYIEDNKIMVDSLDSPNLVNKWFVIVGYDLF